MVEPALYYALRARKYELARKLYLAGDRLDDLRIEPDFDTVPAEVLTFLNNEMHCGRNYFYDESKPLSECCRSGAFKPISRLIQTASQDELNKSIEPVIHRWIHSKAPVYVDILEFIIGNGGRLSEQEKKELLDIVDTCSHWPLVMRPPEEDIEKVTALLKLA